MRWIRKIARKFKNQSGITKCESGSSDRTATHSVAVIGDNPIRHPGDDALGRVPASQSFARHVLSLDAREGVVVGVLGPWGSGKTSFINLARDEFDRAGVPVLDFNPWMFSGTEQLVESFFVELAAQLKVRPGLDKLGKALADYGEAFSSMGWLPLLGPWFERGGKAAKVLGKMFQRRKEGVGRRREELTKVLANLDKPIVVVLDDIDRLTASEIREVFRVVRLIASLPNIIYIVAFDRARVEQALSEQGIPGRDYLEKILQATVDLPAVPGEVLIHQTVTAVTSVLHGIENPGRFDEQRWPDVFAEIIKPLIKNMRDVRRYAAAVHGTVTALSGEIALVDVLALEAVRLFLPEVFRQLHNSVEGLTAVSRVMVGGLDDPPRLKAQIDCLIQTAGTHDGVVRAVIQRLFPAAERHIGGSHYGYDWRSQWLRERRVAHEDILRLYLERAANEGLQAFTDAERAWACMGDRHALDGFLRSLDPSKLPDVIAQLETFEDQFAPEHVVPATIVLLNLLPDLPERQRGMFDLDPRMIVIRVVYRLVRSLKDPAAVEAAVHQILPKVNSLSSKLELIRIVGYRERAGHKLVSEAAAAALERAWRDEVRAATVDNLVRERGLYRVLLLVKRESDPSEGPLIIDDSPRTTLAILRSARSETISQTVGSRYIRRSPRLAWDSLVELFGDEATLKARIESLNATRPEGADELLELAGRYLSGWRPSEDE